MERMKNPMGIMQGRLSPPVAGKIQAFPAETWANEFRLAREAGLDCIEWVYEKETEHANPLKDPVGIARVIELSRQSGVAVWSVCADYYMTERLVTECGIPDRQNLEHLKLLIERCSRLGVRYIVLPFVDSSSLRSTAELSGLVKMLESALPICEKYGIELHLETDVEPSDLKKIFESIDSPKLKANYDIGNSASLGREPSQELTSIGSWLGSVHVKDRLLGGGTVALGSGAADFPTCFHLIRSAGYKGPFILQAARDESISEVELARKNKQFIEKHLEDLERDG